MRALVPLLLALGAATACGKYGPPVRASEQAKKEAEPRSVEVPLPSVTQPPTPAPQPAPEPEREPPPEGSP